MFDLFRSRDKMVRIMLGGLLTIVALSMLVYLIPGMGVTVPSASDDDVIAEVGKNAITARDIRQLVQQQYQSQQLPADMVKLLVPQMIDQRVAATAVAYQAQRMGYQVTDAELAENIRSLPNIGSLPPDQYRAYIESTGQSVPQFENNMRTAMYLAYLERMVTEGVVVTPQEVKQEYDRRNEKVKIDYIAFDPTKLQQEIKPSEDDLKKFFSTHKAMFRIPEERSFEIIVADPVKIAAQMQISEDQERQYYDSHKDEYRTPERVKVRHILLMTTGKSKDEVDKIHAQAENLLKQIKGGADFAELAKKYSEDPGSKANGGDLGWVVRGQTVKNFENAAFSLKPGEISNVITTEYGFHILQVMEKQDAHLQTFDEVKNQIADTLKKASVNDKVENLADQARAELAKNPGDAQQIAMKLGLEYVRADKVKNGDPLPVIGANKPVDDAAFSMMKGEVSPVIEGPDRLAVVVLDTIYPARDAGFAEVQAQVRSQYVSQEAARLASEKAQKAADMLKQNGGDLKAVAKAMGMEVKTSDYFTQNGAVEGLGSAQYFLSAFSQPAGASLGLINTGTVNVVAKVADKQLPDPTKLAAERDSILLQLKQKKAEERDNLFQDSVVRALEKQGKVKIHKDAVNRLIASFRS